MGPKRGLAYRLSTASLERTLMTVPTTPVEIEVAFNRSGMKAAVTKIYREAVAQEFFLDRNGQQRKKGGGYVPPSPSPLPK